MFAGGLDLNTADEKGWTPIQLSLIHKQDDIFEVLRQAGADLRRPTPKGHTLQELALFFNRRHVMEGLPESSKLFSGNFFTDSSLNRESKHRMNSEWIHTRMEEKESEFILINHRDVVVQPVNRRSASLLRVGYADVAKHLPTDFRNLVYLGEKDSGSVFAVHLDRCALEDILKEHSGSELIPSFPGALKLLPDDAAVYGHAMGILSWHRSHKFCSVCGHPVKVVEAGYKTSCSNEKCNTHKGKLHYFLWLLNASTTISSQHVSG
jgi:hypothetical protein